MGPTPKICIFYFSLVLNGFDVGPYVKINKLYMNNQKSDTDSDETLVFSKRIINVLYKNVKTKHNIYLL